MSDREDIIRMAREAGFGPIKERNKMEKILFEDLMTIDSVLEDLAQGDMPTHSDTEYARKAFARIKQSTSPVLFTSDEVSLFLDASELFVRESCPSLRLAHMRLEEKENLSQKLTFKMMCFVSEDVNPDTAISHVRNALDLLHTIHFGNETKRSQDILRAAMRSLERALG